MEIKKGNAMNVFEETLTLNNGVAIPRLALGTWLIDDAAVADAVKAAAAIGYRHIDTAQAYGNERGVGEGIRGCGVPREKLFVTTKVAAEHKTYDAAAASIDASLAKMGLAYLDMVIIHSPQPWKAVNQSDDRYYEGNREAWRSLEDALSAGKVRAIGVSNFGEGDIDNILGACRVKPAVNQVLAHIANTPKALIDRCQAQGIAVEAYSPVAHGEAMKRPEIAAMADKYGVSVPQLCIRYDWQLGLIVLPKTANPDHMRDNAAIDFAISDADMQTLLGLETMTDYGDAGFFPVFGGRL
ncbi:oxidoreductase, aldo/keto reductase family protein [Pseudoramibacter alactolyticus ATCC 23263]|uniref:Oxidoreductase, aldo/keto reductase family protein n=2 Tax=Pseudoramibacter TaxID=113286 RepID=E6MK50_9FIRM|nr:oxidoreductase, aldo/keto reductase family protein [Pseudoramibacter alactolyticus ATCC 23263]